MAERPYPEDRALIDACLDAIHQGCQRAPRDYLLALTLGDLALAASEPQQ